jgi:hypothetical protein
LAAAGPLVILSRRSYRTPCCPPGGDHACCRSTPTDTAVGVQRLQSCCPGGGAASTVVLLSFRAFACRVSYLKGSSQTCTCTQCMAIPWAECTPVCGQHHAASLRPKLSASIVPYLLGVAPACVRNVTAHVCSNRCGAPTGVFATSRHLSGSLQGLIGLNRQCDMDARLPEASDCRVLPHASAGPATAHSAFLWMQVPAEGAATPAPGSWF